MTMDIYLQTQPAHIEEYVQYASSNDLNIEIADLSHPELLNDQRKYDIHLDYLARTLGGFKGRLSMHGPFYNMDYTSPDRDIVKIVRNHIDRTLKSATKLGVRKVILHSTFNPMIKVRSYKKQWLDNSVAFFIELCRDMEFEGKLLLENIWDPDPTLYLELMKKLRIHKLPVYSIVDIGHVNLFSDRTVYEWITTLKRHIRYFHLNNNLGEYDDHNDLFNGNIKCDRVIESILKHIPHPEVCLEVHDDLQIIIENVNYLRSLEKMQKIRI